MQTVVLLVVLLLADVTPLGPDQLQRLATARDDGDHREEALAALLENVGTWSPGTADEPIRLRPDLDDLLAEPAASRGALCRLDGIVQQRTILDRPFETVVEWFVRDDDDRPVIVYVPAGGVAGFDVGDRVQLDARFYKRMTFVARDGLERRYAAFVAARAVRPPVAAGEGWSSLTIIVVPVAVMLVVFLALFLYVRTHRRPPPRAVRSGEGAPFVEDPGPLPDDPVEALAVLKRRAAESEDSG